jgi:acyl-CoA thioesterase-1
LKGVPLGSSIDFGRRDDSGILGQLRPVRAGTSDEATDSMNGRRKCMIGAAGVLCALAWTASAASPRVVLVLGDSLSAAYGMDSHQGWVALLQAELGAGVKVVNASSSGETTDGGCARIAGDLARSRADVVIIALGGNDGLRGLPIQSTRDNLAFMIRAAKSHGARVVLAGMQIPPNYGLDYARQFRELYAALARSEKIELIPFLLEGMADRLELFQADKIHPTAAAQPTILKNALPAIRRALAAKAAP